MSLNVGIELHICEGNRHVFQCMYFSFKLGPVLKLLTLYWCPNTCAAQNISFSMSIHFLSQFKLIERFQISTFQIKHALESYDTCNKIYVIHVIHA